MEPEHSGQIPVPDEPHPTLGRAMSNPVVKLIFSAFVAILLSYVASTVAEIKQQQQRNTDAIGELQQWRAARDAVRESQDAAYREQLKANEDRNQRAYDAFMRSLDGKP